MSSYFSKIKKSLSMSTTLPIGTGGAHSIMMGSTHSQGHSHKNGCCGHVHNHHRDEDECCDHEEDTTNPKGGCC